MKIAPRTFIVVTDVTMISEVISILSAYPERPEYIIVFPAAGNSKLGVVPSSALTADLANLQLLQHPDLETNIGLLDAEASMEIREQAVSDYGMVAVLMRTLPVELLSVQVYGDEMKLSPGLNIPELKCPHCGKLTKPKILINKRMTILFCPRCGGKLK